MPGVIGCNMLRLSCEQLLARYGENVFEEYKLNDFGIPGPVMSKFASYFYSRHAVFSEAKEAEISTDVQVNQTYIQEAPLISMDKNVKRSDVKTSAVEEQTCDDQETSQDKKSCDPEKPIRDSNKKPTIKKKPKKPLNEAGLLATVKVGQFHKAMCIPANSTMTGRMYK